MYNILDPPEAIPVGGSAIFLTGSNVTLIAFLSIIDGNPAPSVSWTGPDGQIITNGGRFNTSILGQITVIEAKNGDNGSYTCTISNGIAPNLSQAVELVFASKRITISIALISLMLLYLQICI